MQVCLETFWPFRTLQKALSESSRGWFRGGGRFGSTSYPQTPSLLLEEGFATTPAGCQQPSFRNYKNNFKNRNIIIIIWPIISADPSRRVGVTRTQVVLPRDNPFEILLDRFTVALPNKKNQRGGGGRGGWTPSQTPINVSMTHTHTHTYVSGTHIYVSGTHIYASGTHIYVSGTHMHVSGTLICFWDTHICFWDTHICFQDTHICFRDTHVCFQDKHICFQDMP